MKMSGHIRVKTDSKYRSLYNDLKNLAVGDFHELFFLCACLGFKKNETKPLGRNKEDRFWSDTITPDEYVSYYSMLLVANSLDFTVIQDDKSVLSKTEEYANAGMEILIKDVLHDYLMPGTEAEPKLDFTCSRELAKVLLYHIFEQVDSGNSK